MGLDENKFFHQKTWVLNHKYSNVGTHINTERKIHCFWTIKAGYNTSAIDNVLYFSVNLFYRIIRVMIIIWWFRDEE